MQSLIDAIVVLAFAFVAAVITLFIFGRIAVGASADYETVLTWPDGTVIIAPTKSAGDCEAVKGRRWQPIGAPPIADATILCRPAPGAFSDRSNCIAGYNCRP